MSNRIVGSVLLLLHPSLLRIIVIDILLLRKIQRYESSNVSRNFRSGLGVVSGRSNRPGPDTIRCTLSTPLTPSSSNLLNSPYDTWFDTVFRRRRLTF